MRNNHELDSLIDNLFPVLPVRDAADFLFDPAKLEGYPTVRDYYVEYLHWLDIPLETLPSQRVYLHGDRPGPANLEVRGDGEVSLFISMRLFRSFDLVKMALAHELTHLFLMRNGLQNLPRSAGATLSLPDNEEIRTDVASIVLGFGKLVLNGVTEFARLHAADGQAGQLGYLPVSSFAYLYQRVNALVGVPSEVAVDGLNAAARQAISQ